MKRWQILRTCSLVWLCSLSAFYSSPPQFRRANGRATQWLRVVDSSWNLMAHGDAREEKWRGNWWMQWVASTLHTTSEHGLSSITTADAYTSAASSRLNWRPSADLNGLVSFAERRNLVSERVSSHFKWSLRQASRMDVTNVVGQIK